MDRLTLELALDSVASQSYSNIEIIVVNAKQEPHRPLGASYGRCPLKLVSTNSPLDRSQAANIAMEHARGDYFIFLDDDDYFLPDHLAKLAQALIEHPDLQAAYSGVKLVDQSGAIVTVLDEPWDAARLRGANYLPIHAVMFSRTMHDAGCRFDESLQCLEDWEFWLKLSLLTNFYHVPGISAVYCIDLGNSGISMKPDAERHLTNRSAIFENWHSRFTSREWVETMYWFERARDHFQKSYFEQINKNQSIQQRLDEANLELSCAVETGKKTKDLLNEKIRQLDEANHHLKQVTIELAQDQQHLAHLKQAVLTNAAQNINLKETIQDLLRTIDALAHSTSWKITGPLRFGSRLLHGQYHEAFAGVRRRALKLGKEIYYRSPAHWRDPMINTAYRYGGIFFNGLGHYEMWRQRHHASAQPSLGITHGEFPNLINIDNVTPHEDASPGRIAIHAHIFYIDLVKEFVSQLRHMPFDYDLFVSVTNSDIGCVCKDAFKALPHMCRLTIEVVVNRGRDIAPIFCAFDQKLQEYDFISHIHGKKSLYNNGATSGWREYLLTGLFGSEKQIRKIFKLLASDQNFGLVYPQNFSQLPYQANTWLSNQSMGRQLCQRIGVTQVPSGYFDFPAGSMFWARSDALKPLFNLGLRLRDFPEESGQKDATIAHCLERMFAIAASHAGFKTAILGEKSTNRWSTWGMEQYFSRRREYLEAAIASSEIQLVIFDIFDTLLLRPFLNPESVKSIVAARSGGIAGCKYLEFRAKAEEIARTNAGRDVGLDAVFKEFSLISGLPGEAVNELRQTEELVERNAVSARMQVIEILRFAISKGKRVVLASDMYLPQVTIEAMLKDNEIDGWHALYVSSEIGLRKDSGALYRHLLDQEGFLPSQSLMIGDNEHSDFQIPSDMGMNIWHVMRPVEMARALPRLEPIVRHVMRDNDLNEHLTLGLITQTNFEPVFYSEFDSAALVLPDAWSIGYSILGPLVLSFTQWLEKTAQADGVKRLYFLSREGQFLKTVYEAWTQDRSNTPSCEYLVLSRRAVTVSMLTDLEDIYLLARPRYFPNSIINFIYERYGITLADSEWTKIFSRGLWKKNQLVEVVNEEIDHLKPLLSAIQSNILSQSEKERPGLLAYLNDMKLHQDSKLAVVDVGYAATIQSRLNRLTGRAVHGYYMITEKSAQNVAEQYDVLTKGCFGQYVNKEVGAPALMSKSFTLEKLLSSDDAQIVHYLVAANGQVKAEYRDLSNEELETRPIRMQVRDGAIRFVQDAKAICNSLHPEFSVPAALSQVLYESFVNGLAPSEAAIMQKLVLDDYYCGRGLVS